MFPSKSKEENFTVLNQGDHEISSLHDAANKAGRKVRSAYNSASDEISQVGYKVSTEIRENPIRSSVIALGVGAVIGMLLRR